MTQTKKQCKSCSRCAIKTFDKIRTEIVEKYGEHFNNCLQDFKILQDIRETITTLTDERLIERLIPLIEKESIAIMNKKFKGY